MYSYGFLWIPRETLIDIATQPIDDALLPNTSGNTEFVNMGNPTDLHLVRMRAYALVVTNRLLRGGS